MNMSTEFRRPLRGGLYRSFFDHSRTIGASLCLIVTEGAMVRGETASVFARLRPWLLSETEVREWPGSRIEDPDSVASRHEFALSGEVADIVKETADHIYSWQFPHLPGDPHILRPDGSVWFGSTTTEEWSWLEPKPGELENLRRAITDIDSLF